MGRLLTILGVIVTIAYSISIAILMGDRVNQLRTIPLNELGDFLAGVFGPLAIFWLILGFLQQGKELQQSTQALELQAKELNNSVQQQKHLVEVSRLQMEAEVDSLKYERQKQLDVAKPRIVFGGIGGITSHGRTNFYSEAKNFGGHIINVTLKADTNIELSPSVIALWETNKEIRFEWRYINGDSKETANFLIRYTDSLGNRSEENYSIGINSESQSPTIEIHKE